VRSLVPCMVSSILKWKSGSSLQFFPSNFLYPRLTAPKEVGPFRGVQPVILSPEPLFPPSFVLPPNLLLRWIVFYVKYQCVFAYVGEELSPLGAHTEGRSPAPTASSSEFRRWSWYGDPV